MTIELDPEGNEASALFDIVDDFQGLSVIEIGCGDGRLTWKYAPFAGEVLGIDPDPDRIERAINNLPQQLMEKVRFLPLTIEDYSTSKLTSISDASFDLAILAWSL